MVTIYAMLSYSQRERAATEACHADNFVKRPESVTASEHLRRRWAAPGRAASRWLLEIIENSKASTLADRIPSADRGDS
jgi:hypothetical protein